MPYKSRRLATLLLTVLMLSGCASSKPPLIEPPRAPAPPAELLAPLPKSPVNVDALLLNWTNMLEAWRQRQALCRDTPQACV